MASTYDLTTDRGKVRLGLGDTSTTAGEYVFEDDEIDYFLSVGSTVNGAVIAGLQTLIASKAHRVKRATVQGLTIDDTAQIAALQAALQAIGGLPVAGIVNPALMPFDFDYSDSL